jgi:hypothetical protein
LRARYARILSAAERAPVFLGRPRRACFIPCIVTRYEKKTSAVRLPPDEPREVAAGVMPSGHPRPGSYLVAWGIMRLRIDARSPSPGAATYAEHAVDLFDWGTFMQARMLSCHVLYCAPVLPNRRLRPTSPGSTRWPST